MNFLASPVWIGSRLLRVADSKIARGLVYKFPTLNIPTLAVSNAIL